MGSLYCLSPRAINRRRIVFADNTAQHKEKADETEGMDLPEHFNDKAVVLIDLPPLKWSSVRYDFHQEDRINGKEAAYS